jgi:hypothetical protein
MDDHGIRFFCAVPESPEQQNRAYMKAVKIKNIVIVYPEGRICNNSANHYRHQLELLFAKYKNCDFVVNMGNVPSICSHGIAVHVYMEKNWS